MFCIDLWGFSIDPLLLVYNFAKQETPVLSILLSFRDLPEHKRSYDFSGVNIFPK
jgi:hypothetical protein